MISPLTHMAGHFALLVIPLAFFLAMAVGIFIRFRRFSAFRSMLYSGDTSVPPSGSNKLVITANSKNLTIKCTCGALHTFHAGDSPDPSGAEPFPTDDTYTCTSCGRPVDLKGIRKLAGGAF